MSTPGTPESLAAWARMKPANLMGMPCLSIMQPWAWLIANGYKDIENRSWRSNHTGMFLIHAGKKYDKDFPRDWAEEIVRLNCNDIAPGFKIPGPGECDLGGIVGMGWMSGCVHDSPSPWYTGDHGFTIAAAHSLAFIPCRGALSFFPMPKIEEMLL